MSVTGGKTHHDRPSSEPLDFPLEPPKEKSPALTPGSSARTEPSAWPAHLQDKLLSVSDAMQIHPVAKLFDAPETEVLAAMREHIKADGIGTPIVLNKAKDTIIDGVTRWRIAYELGFRFGEVPIEVFIGKDENIPRFIIAKNALRRHMTKASALKLADEILKVEAAGKSHENNDPAPSSRSFNPKPGKRGGSTKDPDKAKLKERAEQLVGKPISTRTVEKHLSGQSAKGTRTTRLKKEKPFRNIANEAWAWFHRRLKTKYKNESDHPEAVRGIIETYLSKSVKGDLLVPTLHYPNGSQSTLKDAINVTIKQEGGQR